MPDQDYSMCIRQEKGFCCTKYSVCPSENGLFSLYLKADVADPPMGMAQTEELCTADYVLIEGIIRSLSGQQPYGCGRFLVLQILLLLFKDLPN